jgi:murein DD-endopeptidase MepM/ murein hydrolase activator NlpD
MSFLKYLKNLKGFSLVIVPDDTSHEAKMRKFTPLKIISFLILYSLILSLLGYYFFNITGIGNVILPGKFTTHGPDIQKIEELNDKMIFLARELQLLRSTNQRLKYALVLGDSSLADSLRINEDTVKSYYKIPGEGNLLSIVYKLISEIYNSQQSIFFIQPADGYLSRKFEPEKGHAGIDIVMQEGSPVYAAAGGYILFSGYTTDNGYVLIINHADNYISSYKHCSVLLKKERDTVEQGELIALSGNSGVHSTGPHLHFEIWQNGRAINPETVLIKKNKESQIEE